MSPLTKASDWRSDLNMQHVDAELEALRPAMEADGGGVELVSVKDGVVTVKLLGTCLACPSASMTLRMGIERTLKAQFPWIQEVVRVS